MKLKVRDFCNHSFFVVPIVERFKFDLENLCELLEFLEVIEQQNSHNSNGC